MKKLWLGDCLDVLAKLPDQKFDLIYVDPPFFTNRVLTASAGKFDDRWKTLEAFLEFLRPRLTEMQRVLKPTGSLILHLDWHASHYAKVMLDQIFGYENFINEIIWYYKTGGTSRRWLGRKHDNLLWYAKGEGYQFFPFKEKSYLAHKYGFKNVEILQDDRGYYTNVYARDVWDIAALRGNQPESVGYATQKPEELLERIIKMCTKPGDLVGDFFAGSGTTLAVAKRLGRDYLGSDQSPDAIAVIERRLSAISALPAVA